MVSVLDVLKAIISKGNYGFCSILGKIIVVQTICEHPELSDEKVKNITNMML